jgi:hypothetical protein
LAVRRIFSITIRRAQERGHFDHGWLHTYQTFSFAHYFDPEFMGFRSLRVINEDTVAGQQGFGTHGHADMEIITYIVSGELTHKDSTGAGGVLYPDDVQHMTAGPVSQSIAGRAIVERLAARQGQLGAGHFFRELQRGTSTATVPINDKRQFQKNHFGSNGLPVPIHSGSIAFAISAILNVTRPLDGSARRAFLRDPLFQRPNEEKGARLLRCIFALRY